MHAYDEMTWFDDHAQQAWDDERDAELMQGEPPEWWEPESIRDMSLRLKMCLCGTVDPEGAPDFAGDGVYWHCRTCLDREDDARLIPSHRVTISEVL